MGFRHPSGKAGINRYAALRPYSSAVLGSSCYLAFAKWPHEAAFVGQQDIWPAKLTDQKRTGIVPALSLRRATAF
jgi:hypothetical protein